MRIPPFTARGALGLLASLSISACNDDIPGPATEFALEDAGRMVCAPGELPTEQRCIAAGAECSAGFVPDGRGGCDPILPVEDCPKGLMAIPGDVACREVAPCGEGEYGNIPLEAGTVFANAAYPGTDSDGSRARPWTTLAAAYEAAPPGGMIALASGTYANVDVRRSVRIWGRCPRLVEVRAPDRFSAAGPRVFELHQVAITGDATGVAIADGASVLLDRVWVHDLSIAVNVSSAERVPTSSLVLRDSLIESLNGFALGVTVESANATVARTAIRTLRGTEADSQLRHSAIRISNINRQSEVRVESSLIDRAEELGVDNQGGKLSIRSTVIRRTVPRDHLNGGGILVQTEPGILGAVAELELTSSVLAENAEVALFLKGAVATVTSSTIRRTRPRVNGRGGAGIVLDRADAPSHLRLVRSLLDFNTGAGLRVVASTAIVESSVVRDTQAEIGDVMGFGVLADSSLEPAPGARVGAVEITGSQFDGNQGAGVVARTASVALFKTRIGYNPIPGLDRLATADGLVAMSGSAGGARVTLQESLIEHYARAGIANFASTVSLRDTAVLCNGVTLNGQATGTRSFVFDDQGANRCGCGEDAGVCAAASTGLVPPVIR